jgi:acetyl-CoA C-acetyltransferase
MAAPQYCLRDREGPLLIVTLNRSEQRNSLGPDAIAELVRVFDEFEADTTLRAVILTGAGEVFCAGTEVRDAQFAELTRRLGAGKPVVAAVNGDARAEGFELALACDLIIAVEDARFTLGQPANGAAQQLVRQIPLKRAMAVMLAGRPVTAPEGVALGFVNDLCARGEALATARTWAQSIVERGARDLRDTKQAAMQTLAARG